MSYNKKFPATLIVPAAEAPPPPPEKLSFFLDKECTQPLTQIDLGPILENNGTPETAWFEFYVRNDSPDSFGCLVPTVYPRGPLVFFPAMFTPGLVVGNTNEAFEPGEVGWMAIKAHIPDLDALRAAGVEQPDGSVLFSFEVDIRADEVLLPKSEE